MLLSVSLKTSEAFHIFALLAWILSFKKSYQNQIKIYFLGILKYLNINENREDVHVIFLSLAQERAWIFQRHMSCSIIYYENEVRNQGHDLGQTQKCGGVLCIYFQWIDTRRDCSFCWYWWIYWPSQFKLLFS
jgi:hypothetical protein